MKQETQKKYDKLVKEIYPIIMEIEELEYIFPRFLEIVNFYFGRYGFGTKIKKPNRYIQMDKEYDLMIKRLSDLKEKYKNLNCQIKEIENKITS